MPGPIRLFVSSSPELYAEREVVGQVVATLPLTIGWRIDHTPLPGEPGADVVSLVTQCDLYAVILGQDFAAPMGAEVRSAIAASKSPLAFQKRCTHSPSSQDAIRHLNLEWRVFLTLAELRPMFTRDLLHAVLQRSTELGLELAELEGLLALAKQVDRELEKGKHPGRERGDAGKSGVILGREIWEVEPQDR
jgi:hypothetical protein